MSATPTGHRPRKPRAGTRLDPKARSKHAGAARAGGTKSSASLYEEVTQRIVAELEAGRYPWVQPWGTPEGGGVAPGLPRNARTGRTYSGINVLILWGAVIERGYPSQGWLTFRQALDAGGSVRKGERGTGVVYADRFVPKEANSATRRGSVAAPNANEPPEAPRAIPFLKRFTVFNVAQCEGLPPGLAPEPVALAPREVVPLAEAVIEASGVEFRTGGTHAFYAPSADFVQVPPQPAFFEQINYYRTALHELTHATGHRSRLDRNQTGAFASRDYAREELVAEMGSAFLCAALGIQPTVRHADYLACWLDVLRSDQRAIFRAAAQASKAADWLLARHRDLLGAGAQSSGAAAP